MITIAIATSPTVRLYGLKVSITRRTVARSTGLWSASRAARRRILGGDPCVRGYVAGATTIPGPRMCADDAARAQHRIHHRRGELPGEGVLLRRVEAPEQRVGADGDLGAVTEPGLRPGRVSARGERPQRPVPAERAERHDDPQPCQGLDLTHEEGQAPVALERRGLVRGRRATVHRGHVGPPQSQAVVERLARGLVREPGPEHRRVEEVPRSVSREDPAGAVPAVGRGGEPEHEHTGVGVAEPRHRPSPVGLVGEPRDLLARRPLPPLDQPRACMARDDVALDPRERIRAHAGTRPRASSQSSYPPGDERAWPSRTSRMRSGMRSSR